MNLLLFPDRGLLIHMKTRDVKVNPVDAQGAETVIVGVLFTL